MQANLNVNLPNKWATVHQEILCLIWFFEPEHTSTRIFEQEESAFIGVPPALALRLSGVGLGGNWFPVTGSTASNRFPILINPANGSVFYRLHQQYPQSISIKAVAMS